MIGRLSLALTLFMGVVAPAYSAEITAPQSETAYDRVIRTGTLRCGYGIYPPFIEKDANTGTMSGIMVDMMDAFSKQTGLKVEWTQEVDWGQLAEDLASQKVDAICSTMWGTPKRALRIAFSQPVFFSLVVPVVRQDDTRFDRQLQAANDATIKIGINDNDISDEIARADFTKAQRVPRAQIGGEQQLLIDLASKKTDITFSEPSLVANFIKANSGLVRILPTDHPVRAFQNVIGVAQGEMKLLGIINATLITLQTDGTQARLFAPYMTEHKGFIRLPAPPYGAE